MDALKALHLAIADCISSSYHSQQAFLLCQNDIGSKAFYHFTRENIKKLLYNLYRMIQHLFM
jgi:thermostable 8-oxoguanine DNA glycosylase